MTLVFLVCLQTVLLSTVSNCAKAISLYWNTTNSMSRAHKPAISGFSRMSEVVELSTNCRRLGTQPEQHFMIGCDANKLLDFDSNKLISS
ncbi:hypothetical protein M0802_009739 [Mischocyttarus mexicanus]|nr:hypothetical protein M0802_009739 [Mischocyttarus mexicanus]